MKTRLFAALLATLPMPALANEAATAMEAYLNESILGWATDPVVLDVLRAQNAAHDGIDQARIDEMDSAWQSEIGMGVTPTIDPVASNPAAEFLRGQVEASGGMMTEVILMDNHGLNATVSHITSDMWQGDEAKFTETYAAGPDAVHYSEIEKDESSGRYQGQISFTLVDPDSGEPIGAMTVGVDAEALL